MQIKERKKERKKRKEKKRKEKKRKEKKRKEKKRKERKKERKKESTHSEFKTVSWQDLLGKRVIMRAKMIKDSQIQPSIPLASLIARASWLCEGICVQDLRQLSSNFYIQFWPVEIALGCFRPLGNTRQQSPVNHPHIEKLSINLIHIFVCNV